MTGLDIVKDVKGFFSLSRYEISQIMRKRNWNKPMAYFFFKSPLETAKILVDKFGYSGSSAIVVRSINNKLVMNLTIYQYDTNHELKEFNRTYII